VRFRFAQPKQAAVLTVTSITQNVTVNANGTTHSTQSKTTADCALSMNSPEPFCEAVVTVSGLPGTSGTG
jgi:hypothetical protein